MEKIDYTTNVSNSGFADRLKKVIKYIKFNTEYDNQALIAKKIDFGRTNLSAAINGDERYLTEGLAKKITDAFTNISSDWLINGKGEMLIDPLNKLEKANDLDENENENLESLDKNYVVSLLPISAMGGTLVGVADSLDPYQTFQKLVSPIKGADWALTVTGESMSPEYPNGSVVLIKKINERAFIDWGKTFVLDTCNGVIIKKLMPSDDKEAVRCESINIDYPPFDVHFEDIYGVYRVLMCLSSK